MCERNSSDEVSEMLTVVVTLRVRGSDTLPLLSKGKGKVTPLQARLWPRGR
jgi:hypothetical protein